MLFLVMGPGGLSNQIHIHVDHLRVIDHGVAEVLLNQNFDPFVYTGTIGPTTLVTAFFTGGALALQIYLGSSRFNAESLVASIVALGITRELGPVLAGLMVAGRVGASIAAELGTMRVTEQIDALVTLATNPFKYLVGPRIIAAVVTLPILVGIADVIGMTLPGTSSIPADDVNHMRMCASAGRRIVDMVWEDLKPFDIMTRASFLNAIRVAMAMGCSTNAVIHVIAMARRAGHHITLDDFDAASRIVPVIANVRPSGETYLMEDFYYAGGLKALMKEIAPLLDLDQVTVSGKRWSEELDGVKVHNPDVIRSMDTAIYPEGALAVLKGNLAPRGCVIKPSACAPHLRQHSGPAIVFDDYPSMKAVIDRDDFDVTPDHILVLRNAGPQGGPGMPEWGMLPIPKKLVKQGVRDMLRISDARMSGTSYGACVLHVSPESYIGGPLALVQNGDIITIDIPARRIHMDVSDAELARRKAAWQPLPKRFERGYGHMFSQHIMQAHEGCDFDYLETSFGAPVSEPVIF